MVTIIIRTHGKDLFWLRESIASVFHQTYQHIEIIIVEDGGTFAENFVQNIASKSSKIKVKYFSQPKMGRSAAGNCGLENASGDYFMFLDQDDYLFSDHIEILVNELTENKNIDVAYSLAWIVKTNVFYLDNKISGYHELTHELPSHHLQPFSFEALLKVNLLPIQAALFKRKVYEKCGGFDTNLEYLEDWNLWLRYAHFFCFKLVPKLTSCYRVPANKNLYKKRLNCLLNANQEAINSYEQFVSKTSGLTEE